MKGINLKKLGAIVAGSALLAGSLAFGGSVSFQNVELVNAQGQPVAKIVVGSKAAISDAIAAAKIAQRLANSAFVEKEYSAEVEGTEGLSVEVTGGGPVSCSISGKEVTLELRMPGLVSTQQHELAMLIAEKADKDVTDRDPDVFNVNDNLWDREANPFQNQIGSGGFIESTSSVQLYKVDGGKLDALKDFNVKGSKFGVDLTERQNLFIDVSSKWDNNADDVIAEVKEVIYQIVFGPDKQGLPLCPGRVDTDVTGTGTGYCSADDRIEVARVPVQIFGGTWYITKVDIANGAYNFADKFEVKEALAGSKIKLAKESKYGIVNVGSSLETDDGYKITLGDISSGDNKEAIIAVYDPAGNLVVKDQIKPGTSKELSLGGGRKARLHVYQTAPGYTLTEKWAEIALLKDEIELEHGSEFIKDSDSKYNVYFGLTNKIQSPSNNNATTHLKEIVFRARFSPAEKLKKGMSLKISDLPNYEAFTVKYNGISTEDVDIVSLEIINDFGTVQLAGNSSANVTVEKAILVKSRRSDAFRTDHAFNGAFAPGNISSKRFGSFYYITKLHPSSSANGASVGDVLFKSSDDNKYYLIDVQNNTASSVIKYAHAGSDFGAFFISNRTDIGIYFTEGIGKVNNVESYGVLGFRNDTNDKIVPTHISGPIPRDDEVTFYLVNRSALPSNVNDLMSNISSGSNALSSFGYTNGTNYNSGDGFITPRGTKVIGGGDSRILQVPGKVAHVKLLFAPKELAEASPETQEIKLREGDSTQVRDVTVKAKSISATATVSGGGAGSGSIRGIENLRGVIVSSDKLEKVSKLKAAVRVPVYDPLVITDAEASGVATKIIVGGPIVNSAAADALSAAGIEITKDNNIVVKAVDSKTIVVAGWSAEDTVAAVNQFLAQLSG